MFAFLQFPGITEIARFTLSLLSVPTLVMIARISIQVGRLLQKVEDQDRRIDGQDKRIDRLESVVYGGQN